MHSFAPEITLITVLATVILSDALATRLRIPSVFLLLALSFLLYRFVPAAIPIDLVGAFDTVILFCIPLIFMGDALHLHFADIKRHAWSIFYLAVVAVALSIAAGASLANFDIFSGLSLGAYVSLFAINMATDAVSVQSVLSRFEGIDHDVKVLIEGESLGNDATAVIAFFFVGLPWMMQGSIDASAAAIDALRVFGVSIVVGVTIGYLFYMLMKLYSGKRSEFFSFVVEGYGAYLIGEMLHVSGILTLISAIVATKAWVDMDLEELETKERRKKRTFLRTLRAASLVATTKERMTYIYEMAKEFGYIAAAVIFFVLAETVDFEALWRYRYEILTMFSVTTAIRALAMAKFAFFGKTIDSIRPVDAKGWFVLTFSGMKGALSIILVHMIPDSFEYKAMFEAVTIGVVVLSIFVYGTILWSYFTFFDKRKKPALFEVPKA